MSTLVANRFIVTQRLQKGGFGEVFIAQDLFTSQYVAIKIEPIQSKRCHLDAEIRAYRAFGGLANIPKLIWYGVENNYALMVMELCGLSLADFLHSANRKSLSLKSVLMAGVDMLDGIEQIHQRGYLHRDIKPANCVISPDGRKIQLIDFGLSTPYIDPQTFNHIEYRESASFRGTDRFASINIHMRREASRRDDLESIGYTLISLATGGLPWSHITSQCKHTRRRLISQSKLDTPIRNLIAGLPIEFESYMHYVRNLSFDGTPNYAFLRSLFTKCIEKNGFQNDHVFDWVQLEQPDQMEIVQEESRTASSATPVWEEETSTVLMQGAPIVSPVSYERPSSHRMVSKVW